AGHFSHLLQAIVEDPGQPVGDLPMLGQEERSQLLIQFAASATEDSKPLDSALTLHELFEAQAARVPDNVAVVFEEAGRLSYADLNGRANQLAHYLRNQGVGPDVLVALCLERGVEMLVGLLGIL